MWRYLGEAAGVSGDEEVDGVKEFDAVEEVDSNEEGGGGGEKADGNEGVVDLIIRIRNSVLVVS